MYFLRKIIFHFPSKKISYLPEKKIIFQIIQERSYQSAIFFWKEHFFGTFEENIIFQCIFLREIIFHFPCILITIKV